MSAASRKLPIGARLRHWHRRLGIAAALFIAWLAISGIILNESALLGLDRVKIGGWLVSAIYGLGDNAPRTGFTAAGHWLVPDESGALLDGRPLQSPLVGVVGFVSTGKMFYVGLADGLAILAPDGQLIETLRATTLPVPTLRRIGLSGDQRIVIEGDRDFASADAENWSELAAVPVSWSQAVELPSDQRNLAADALRPQRSLSRVLADAHSGRLFGRYGHWVIDAAGLAALMLALTGAWIYLRALRRQHHQS